MMILENMMSELLFQMEQMQPFEFILAVEE